MDNEAEVRNREARVQVTFICCVLWAGFWFQFVIGVCYDMPAIYTLSGGNWYAPDYEFYINVSGSLPYSSVAENFLFYSAFGSAVAIFFGWIFTQGVAGKWRLRFAVALFITIILGWSIAAYNAEEAAWTVGLEEEISKTRENWRWAGEQAENEHWLREYRLELERLEKLKKSWEAERD